MKFVISKEKALEQYRLVDGIANITSYSSKTNPDITPILEENTSCLFTIHTPNELRHIKDKARCFYLAQGWDKEQIKGLIGSGIFRFGVDNESDLDTMISYLSGKDVKVELMLRIKLKELSIRTEKYFVFGMDADIIEKRLDDLKGNPNVSSLGVHFHRKTQNMAEWNLAYEVGKMLSEKSLNIIDTLNIGGGLPGVYANVNVRVFDSIYAKLDELKKWLNQKKIKLMIEPGRFISAPAVELVTRIVAIYGHNIIVDASVYNSDMDALIVPVKLLVKGEKKSGTPYVIKGSTPCSMDIFRYRIYLDDPKVGDELVFLNAGAYNFTTDFCDLDKIERVLE